nr:hypothetical protein [Tanacetum cinerariifolium]
EYPAKIHVRSKLHYFPLIKDRLNEARRSLFHTTCFGPWLDITYMENDDGMIYYVIQKQCCADDDSFDLPLIYNVNGRNLHFGRWNDVKIIDVLALIEDEEKFSKVSDEDAIRLCLLLSLEVIFIGLELVSVVDDVLLRMVNNLDAWNTFPWESLCESDRWWTKVPQLIPRVVAWTRKAEFFKLEYFGDLFHKAPIELAPTKAEFQSNRYTPSYDFFMCQPIYEDFSSDLAVLNDFATYHKMKMRKAIVRIFLSHGLEEWSSRSIVGRCKFPWCNDISVDRSFWHGLCRLDDNCKGWLVDEVFIPINEPKRHCVFEEKIPVVLKETDVIEKKNIDPAKLANNLVTFESCYCRVAHTLVTYHDCYLILLSSFRSDELRFEVFFGGCFFIYLLDYVGEHILYLRLPMSKRLSYKEMNDLLLDKTKDDIWKWFYCKHKCSLKEASTSKDNVLLDNFEDVANRKGKVLLDDFEDVANGKEFDFTILASYKSDEMVIEVFFRSCFFFCPLDYPDDIWKWFYCKPKCKLEKGLTLVENDRECKKILELVNFHGYLDVYVGHNPQVILLDWYFKNLEVICESDEEVTSKYRSHEKARKDSSTMSLEELIVWEQEETQSPSYIRSTHVWKKTSAFTSKGKVVLDDFEDVVNGKGKVVLDDFADVGNGKDEFDLQLSAHLCLSNSSNTSLLQTQEMYVDERATRIISGPIGIFQMDRIHKLNNFNDAPTQEYIRKLIDDVSEDDDFKRRPWITTLEFINDNEEIEGGCFGDIKSYPTKGKLEKVVVILTSCKLNVIGDMNVTLKDPSGTMAGTIHYEVLLNDTYAKAIKVGSALILYNVSVFCPKPSIYYLNITIKNLVNIFQKDANGASGSNI